MTSDLKKRFTYHPSGDDKQKKFETIRAKFIEIAELIDGLAPDGREKALSITNLEQAQFWANASIARND
jgi:hypothetical protein